MLEPLYYSLVMPVDDKQITIDGKQLQFTIKKIFRISEIMYLHD